MKENREQGYVYLIRNKSNGLLKIGVTSNLNKRIKQLERTFKHCGVECELVCEYSFNTWDSYGLEKHLHNELKESRIQNEWFDLQDIQPIISSGNKWIENNPKPIQNAKEKVKTIDHLISIGYPRAIAEELPSIYINLRFTKIEDHWEDNKEVIVSELINYIGWTKEEFKKSIEDELFCEAPTEVLNPITHTCYCYKVESMILLYELLHNDRVFEHLTFYIENDFISSVFASSENKEGKSKTSTEVSEVEDEMGNMWEIDFVLSKDVDFRKTILGKMSEEEINEYILLREKRKRNRRHSK